MAPRKRSESTAENGGRDDGNFECGMTDDPLACPDLIAERRYSYGRAAADDKDWAAAAEMYEQALERAPDWAPAWFALADAREKLGNAVGAADAFRKSLRADPSDAQGAAARLALIEQDEQPAFALPQAYVRRLFDDYAPRFEAHLTGELAYRGPELIVAALDAAAPKRRFADALDLGCGTGLMGAAVRARVDRLTGVDLAPAMIEVARRRSVYDRLEVADVFTLLRASAAGAFDCILAADVLCYLGDLRPLLAACRPVLRERGLFVFSVETFDGDDFRLQASMRFQHGRRHVERAAADAGLHTALLHAASTRREAGVECPGLVMALEAP
jgi:predicted TPR repeat methyltransferase